MDDDPTRSPAAPPSDAPAPSERSAIRRAATVVILRPGPRGREVFMVRRSAKSPFMPSTLVFPGGRLDPEDGPPEHDASWETAALRECEEEARLRLPSDALRWFDTWLTPSAESRRRYLTRFFLVEIERGHGEVAEADGHETHEGRWATAAAHLSAWNDEEVDLPPPTVTVLQRLHHAEPDDLETLLEADPSGVILPKVIAVEGRIEILMPHAPEYPEAPGEQYPAPPRVHVLPQRFVREGRRWCPR